VAIRQIGLRRVCKRREKTGKGAMGRRKRKGYKGGQSGKHTEED